MHNSANISERWQASRQQKVEREKADTDDIGWGLIEKTLRYDIPEGLMDKLLQHYGVTLADFAPTGYNDVRLPETATGESLDKVA